MRFIWTGEGLVVQTNDDVLADPGANAQGEAKWQVAVQSLFVHGLLADRGQQGEVFRVTNEGDEPAMCCARRSGSRVAVAVARW